MCPQRSRDFEKLLNFGVLEKVGLTGNGTYYVLKGSQMGERGHMGSGVDKNACRT